ncbi:hypothetical protein MAHJHV65_34830 [Mycobacterium avium subsp. hominissuis]
MSSTPRTVKDESVQSRGEHTRALIVEASRRLFLERGYAGTTVNAVTDACGISQPGFYTYFKDKREVFAFLGDAAYRDIRAVLRLWDSYPLPYRLADVEQFVCAYFAFMDQHGAFVVASTYSAPDDEQFRRARARMQSRVAWILGQAITRNGGAHPPEVVGAAVNGMLDQGWFAVQQRSVAGDESEMVAVLADMIHRMST